jgi:hypothetical protein
MTKSNRQWLALALLALSTVNSQVFTARAQGTAFTYQGRVTDNGAPFSGLGQFKFALVTSTNFNHQATATAVDNSGFITGYNLTYGGSGYVNAPAVTIFGGGGSGAVATAHLTGDAVTSISADNAGSGYTNGTPTVLIAPPPPNISYTTYWSNDGSSVAGSEPSAGVSVAVSNGLFTIVLGDTTQPNMAAIDPSLFNHPQLQLRIWFNDGVHGFAALDPAQNLTPTPYATFANTASNLISGLAIQQNTNGAPNVIGGASVNYVSNTVVGATIAGGGTTNWQGQSYSNSVTGDFGSIGGGYDNLASGEWSTISGGSVNIASGNNATIGGGYVNTASGNNTTVGGGDNNMASGDVATVAGGNMNTANATSATVCGGEQNAASGYGAFVGGGAYNLANGYESTVPGGQHNTASGVYSFAAGLQAKALHNGSFVWSDTEFTDFSSTAANQFSVRASGGIMLAGDVQLAGDSRYHNLSLSGGNALGYLYGSFLAYSDGVHLGYNYYADNGGGGHVSNTGGATSRLTAGYGFVGIYIGGVNSAPNTQRLLANSTGVTVNGTFNNSSDRNVKQDFSGINPRQMLEKVVQLPISEWSYKEDPATRHVGPMGQDFYAVFNIGTDEKHIAPIDEGGVALAAIQGLNQKLNEKDSEIRTLKAQNEALAERLDGLEATLKAIAKNK